MTTHRSLGLLLVGALACLSVGSANAEWQAKNQVIDATNFIVANQCSGTLISIKYRLVLTNNHCLRGFIDNVEKDEIGPSGKIDKVTREVFKTMPLVQKTHKKFEEVGSSTYQANILFHLPKVDVAILQMKADTIPQTIYSHLLPPGKDVERGDTAYVVGNPYMLEASLTKGIISSNDRRLSIEDGDEMSLYQVDAAVNPGNSGGALYNGDGDLIGIPAAGVRGATGLGFAIPAEVIRKALADNCFASVYDDKAPDQDACEKDKLDKENVIRVKAGLPPKEMPTKDSLSIDTAPGFRLDSLMMVKAPTWARAPIWGDILDLIP